MSELRQRMDEAMVLRDLAEAIFSGMKKHCAKLATR